MSTWTQNNMHSEVSLRLVNRCDWPLWHRPLWQYFYFAVSLLSSYSTTFTYKKKCDHRPTIHHNQRPMELHHVPRVFGSARATSIFPRTTVTPFSYIPQPCIGPNGPKGLHSRKQTNKQTNQVCTRPHWLLFLRVVRPPLFWFWEGSNYLLWSCNAILPI